MIKRQKSTLKGFIIPYMREVQVTYFYPSYSPEKVEIWPWKDSLDKYSWNYLKSYVSTALNKKTAEDSTLHETEFISPISKNGYKVYLIGYLFERDDCILKWRRTLEHLQLGGERGYGWGRTKIKGEPKQTDVCFGHDIVKKGNSPTIKMNANDYILAHVLADSSNIKGLIEPLVGRITSERSGFGGEISRADICWAPGSCTKKDSVFKIQPKGIWKECPE